MAFGPKHAPLPTHRSFPGLWPKFQKITLRLGWTRHGQRDRESKRKREREGEGEPKHDKSFTRGQQGRLAPEEKRQAFAILNGKTDPDADDLEKVPYVNAVVSESRTAIFGTSPKKRSRKMVVVLLVSRLNLKRMPTQEHRLHTRAAKQVAIENYA